MGPATHYIVYTLIQWTLENLYRSKMVLALPGIVLGFTGWSITSTEPEREIVSEHCQVWF